MKGTCLCGAIEVTAPQHNEVSFCHCDMCRKWSSGPRWCNDYLYPYPAIENLGGLIVISDIYVVAVAMTWIRAKKYEKSVKEERALEEAKA